MIKALILGMNYHQYKWFIRHFDLPRNEYRYITGTDWGDLAGWGFDMPIILLPNWETNRNYSLGLMNRIGHRFNNIGMITEGELWENEEVPIQYCTKS